MSEKPALVVKLFAGETLVDESNDVGLWQRVLAEIRGIQAPSGDKQREGSDANEIKQALGPLAGYAKAIDVTVEELVGGLDPQSEAPFIRIDERSWEALKRNTPTRGPGSISPTVLAATALVNWEKYQTIGEITLQTVRTVVIAAHLDDPNASRSVNNCDWLQLRGGRIVLNPARASHGARLLRAFCRREPPPEAA